MKFASKAERLSFERPFPMPPPIEPAAALPPNSKKLATWRRKRDKANAIARAWREKNANRIREYYRKRRARKRAQRPRYLCVVQHMKPLKKLLSGAPTQKPEPRPAELWCCRE